MSDPQTVLIVDDEPVIRILIQAALADKPLRILEASSGADAIDVAERERPNLVLLDVGLPGLSGLEVCKRLKSSASTSGIAIVMITALAQTTDREASFAVGADGHITKPFSPLKLCIEVDRLLARA